MSEIVVHQIETDIRHDYLIDASQDRECDLFAFSFDEGAVTKFVFIKAIGIGLPPQALRIGSDIVALANDSVWVLKQGSTDFVRHDHQFPVIGYALTDSGLLVFDHIGCVMLDLRTYCETWRFHRSVLEDYSVEQSVVSLQFDDDVTLKFSLADGNAIA